MSTRVTNEELARRQQEAVNALGIGVHYFWRHNSSRVLHIVTGVGFREKDLVLEVQYSELGVGITFHREMDEFRSRFTQLTEVPPEVTGGHS